jgi:hypothetical protein
MSKKRYFEGVEFQSDGLKAIYWSEQQKIAELIKPKDIFGYLRSNCEIAENVTLRQIIDYIKTNKKLIIFISKYSSVKGINKWLKQLDETPPKMDCEIHYLEIGWAFDQYDYEDEKYFELSTDFGAKGICGSEYGCGNELTNMSLSGSHLASFVDYPIKLNKRIEKYIFKSDHSKISDYIGLHELDPDISRNLEYQGEYSFTLLEVLDAFFWDISFYGPPEKAKEFLNDLAEKASKIKEEFGTMEENE